MVAMGKTVRESVSLEKAHKIRESVYQTQATALPA